MTNYPSITFEPQPGCIIPCETSTLTGKRVKRIDISNVIVFMDKNNRVVRENIDLSNPSHVKTILFHFGWADFIASNNADINIDLYAKQQKDNNSPCRLVQINYRYDRRSYVSQWPPLYQFINRICIDNCEFESCDFLESCIYLEHVSMISNHIKDISVLNKLSCIKSAVFDNNEIQSVDISCSFLNHLSCDGNEIRSFTCDLPNLTSLNLDGNLIEKLIGLDKSPKLETVSVCCNKLDTLDYFKGLDYLKELFCSDNLITSLEPVANCPLVSLVADSNLISSICYPNAWLLNRFEANSNQLVNLDGLKDQHRLFTVCVKNNKLKTLVIDSSVLQTCKCDHNELESLDSLYKCDMISKMSASHNKLTDVNDFISNSHMLYDVDLSNNMITSINIPQRKYARIDSIDLSNNMIISMSTSCDSIVSINLSNNAIDDSSLDLHPKGLRSLNVSHNNITDLSKFSNLSSLRHFNFSYNSITYVESINVLRQLNNINHEGNNILDISTLDNLLFLEKK